MPKPPARPPRPTLNPRSTLIPSRGPTAPAPPRASRLAAGLRALTPRTLRGQLAAAFLVPAVFAFAALIALGYFAARGLLEDELGRHLSDVAASAAANLNGGLVARFEPDNTRTHENLLKRLERVAEQAGARRVFLATLDGRSIADTHPGAPPPGEPDRALAEDRFELDRVAGGQRAASVLYTGTDGVRYKRGFAPVTHEGAVVGVLGVEASSAGYAALDALRNYSLGLGVLALAGLALVVGWFGRALTAPLRRLAHAAARIGAGDLEAPVPEVGRATEVALLARTMDEMRAALRQRDRELQLMLGGIAHEVRNPLGGMSLFVGLLEEDLAERPAELELLGRVKRELGQLSRIVEEFLLYARQVPIERQAVDLRDLVPELAACGEIPVRLAEGAAPEDLTLQADPGQLRRVLLNLVRNAAQAGARAVILEPVPGGVTVVDDGPGVSASAAEHIFDAFFTTKEKGTGLGLALCRRIAAAHGGDLCLDNPGEPGARFTLIVDAG